MTEWVRLIARNLNLIEQGKQTNTGSFTLTASTTTTTVSDSRVGINSVVIPFPTSATAAAEFGTIYISNTTKEQFTVTHANTADSDKTFNYIVIG